MINKNQEDLRICSPQTNAYLSFNNSYAYVKKVTEKSFEYPVYCLSWIWRK
uniref:Uncharacterized protein n=1 Tax=Anguilla anguilla TaxID=7936 RepID=A0A0E9U8X3_ANGAN